MAAAARDWGARHTVAGALVGGVCAGVEEEIRRLGASPAFPVQCSRNAVAAHDCPPPGDGKVLAAGDLAKLDVGVHVEGWVVDTAVTVNVGGGPAGSELVSAVEEALAAALAVAGPGVPISRVSTAIHRVLSARGVRPVRDLCGHGVGRWAVHGPPPVPNEAGQGGGVLEPGMVVAIEPFATTGLGRVRAEGRAEVFRLDPALDGEGSGSPAAVHRAIRAFRGLPFARRQLAAFPPEEVEAALDALTRERRLVGYPPLVEASGCPVAQAEHTVYVGHHGVERLTGVGQG